MNKKRTTPLGGEAPYCAVRRQLLSKNVEGRLVWESTLVSDAHLILAITCSTPIHLLPQEHGRSKQAEHSATLPAAHPHAVSIHCRQSGGAGPGAAHCA